MKYKIQYSARFSSELREIFEYISQDNKTVAQKVINSIYNKAESLCNFSNRGSTLKKEFSNKKLSDLKYVIVYSYYIFYKIQNDTILIYSVWHTSRNLVNLIK